MAAPKVCLVGASGLIGSNVTPSFISALKSGQISSFTVLTRSTTSDEANKLKSQGVDVALADFSSKEALVGTLKGNDILVSCMGTQGDYQKSKDVLVEAAAEAGIKVYVMSEYGTDHRNLNPKFQHHMFENKQHHHAKAKDLGLKPVAIYIGLIMEMVFAARLGFDSKGKLWTIVGDEKQKLAVTSYRDMGPVTLRAALCAFEQPESTPSHMRVFSDNRSVLGYKKAFEAVSGDQIEIKATSLQEAEKHYQDTKDSIPAHMLGPLIPLLMADGSFDHERENLREILNPGNKYFQWRTIEEYAEEVGGRPWYGKDPF